MAPLPPQRAARRTHVWLALSALVALSLLTHSVALALPSGAIARLGHGLPYAVQYSPDGQLLAVATSIGVELRDAHTHERTALLETEVWVVPVAFSPDGATLAGGSADGTVTLWDVAARQDIATLQGHLDSIFSVAFSPDGSTVASGSADNTVKLWDVAARQEVVTLQGHSRVYFVAFSPDGSTLASGDGDDVKLWDVASRQEIGALQGHTDNVNSVAFSPDGATLASGGDDLVKLWNVAARQEMGTLQGHTGSVLTVAFSPDGSTPASGSWDGTVKLWDVATEQEIATVEEQTSRVYSVAFSPDGATLAGVILGRTVKLWDVASGGQEIATLPGHTSEVRSVAFSPDGATLASGSTDRTVKLWDVAARQEIAALPGHSAWVWSLAFSPDGAILASGSYLEAKLWDVVARREIATLQGSLGDAVTFSPDGSTLASDSGWDVKLWDVATRQEIATLRGHTLSVNSVAFSPDGATLASGGDDDSVRFWDVATQQEIATLQGHSSNVYSVAFSPDGATLASSSWDRTVKLWDVAARQETATLQGHTDGVASVAFSSDGVTLASGSEDATVKLWDVAAGQEIASLRGHSRDVKSVAFSPDGAILASGSRDGTVLLWDMSLHARFPNFAKRSAWVVDSDGNRDGAANPGERVELRVRMKNDGDGSARNVRVNVTAPNDHIAVVNAEVTHATWPVGEARNSVGFVLDISPDVTMRDTVVLVDVTADGAGPWQFAYAIPIEPAPTGLATRSLWARDKVTGNDDGDASPGERVDIKARLMNEGDVELQNVVVTLTSADDVMIVNGVVTHSTWPAGVARNSDGLRVHIGAGVTDSVEFTVRVVADNGGTWAFRYTLPIVPLPTTNLVSRAFWMRDKVTGNDDGDANPGERVEIRPRLKNESGTDFANVVATITSPDDVAIVSGQVTHATWPAGVARNNSGLLVDIGLGASGSVALTLDVTADNGGPWKFRYTLPVVPLPAGLAERSFWARDKVSGNADGDANPNERVQIKARLKNESNISFTDVVSTLSSLDPNVTIVNSQVTYGTWPADGAKNNDGLLVDIGASASGSVAFTLDVTADNGGPWQFTYTLPIVPAVTTFAMRSTWSRDKTTGDADGQAEPGERVEVRVRMKNEGQVTGENVVVTLSTTDGNVTIPSATVTHATWPGGVARNNVGFLVDLGATATIPFIVDVTADNAGPWQFTFELPVAPPAAPAALASGLPARNALLPNYPNPFNPETWFPYRLSEPSNVAITIYSTLGRVVRRLDLGPQPAGLYESRSRAAYWDGRNAIGEAVSSGTYIAELRAGSYRATRRVLIAR